MATKLKHGKATGKKKYAVIHPQKMPNASGVEITRARGRRFVLVTTPVAVRFSEDEADLRQLLEARAQASDRSLSGQIKHYARLAALAEDNPDLPMSMIHGIVEAQAELKAGLGEPYRWGVIENG
jgi:hypothetical protein